ncbi:Retrovirus-related Pol polyprotein from transposon TNT 1-94 [Araneus ventricosus]|uniref:Retrovirus-related Pol polyprotein from transposon TNT 1-94 n=1 Tax=Araneus ventricosus TaxID=182803 RepID=A0A4Y2P0P4_ARAVE|nr:Retrovirus-related Pol polyprotein from transposon TNT 1-94 [Araneus ventricosus]
MEESSSLITLTNILSHMASRDNLSAPESPQQNVLAERMNRTLISITRCLLIESGANPNFWAEAVCTASCLHNKRPSNTIEENSPENYGQTRKHLKIFRCRAWSYVQSSQRRSKFDPNAQECVLVGYPDGIKGYKMWNLKGKRFLISRDSTFQEDVFPFKSEQVQLYDEDSQVVLTIENEEI